MEIRLVRASLENAETIWQMQKKAFAEQRKRCLKVA